MFGSGVISSELKLNFKKNPSIRLSMDEAERRALNWLCHEDSTVLDQFCAIVITDGIITGTKVVVPHQEWDNFLGSQ